MTSKTMMRLRSLDPGTDKIVEKTQEIDDFRLVDGDLYILMTDTDGSKREHVISAGVWTEIVTWEEGK